MSHFFAFSPQIPTLFSHMLYLKSMSSPSFSFLFLQGLEGSLNDSDFHMKKQLNFLHDSFVMFCGSIQNIVQVIEIL